MNAWTTTCRWAVAGALALAALTVSSSGFAQETDGRLQPLAHWKNFAGLTALEPLTPTAGTESGWTFELGDGSVNDDGLLQIGTGAAPLIRPTQGLEASPGSPDAPMTMLLALRSPKGTLNKPLVHFGNGTVGVGVALQNATTLTGTWGNKVWPNRTITIPAVNTGDIVYLAVRVGSRPTQAAWLSAGQQAVNWQGLEGLQGSGVKVNQITFGNFPGLKEGGMDYTLCAAALFNKDAKDADLTAMLVPTPMTWRGKSAVFHEGCWETELPLTGPSMASNWRIFCNDKDVTGYQAPGQVLRFDATNSATFQGGLKAMFSPLSMLGLTVEHGVTKMSFAYDVNRETEIGDPEGKVPGKVVLHSNFEIDRRGETRFFGPMQLELDMGTTFKVVGTSVIAVGADVAVTGGGTFYPDRLRIAGTLHLPQSRNIPVAEMAGGTLEFSGKATFGELFGEGTLSAAPAADAAKLTVNGSLDARHMTVDSRLALSVTGVLTPAAGQVYRLVSLPEAVDLTDLPLAGLGATVTFDLEPNLSADGLVFRGRPAGTVKRVENGRVTLTLEHIENNFIVMPMGDSITEGSGVAEDAPSYRRVLAGQMMAAGMMPRFVGPRLFKSSSIKNPDCHFHCGQSGHRIQSASTRGGYLQGAENWLEQAGYPDAITLMIGTNDSSVGADGSFANWKALVKRLVAARPDTWIFVSPITPTRSDHTNMNAYIKGYGDLIRSLFDLTTTELTLPGDALPVTCVLGTLNAEGKKVFGENARVKLASMNDALPVADNAAYFHDWLHPSQKGYDRMAAVWLEALKTVKGPNGGLADPVKPVAVYQTAGALDRITAVFNHELKSADDIVLTINNQPATPVSATLSIEGSPLVEGSTGDCRRVTFTLPVPLKQDDTVTVTFGGQSASFTARGSTAADRVNAKLLDGFVAVKTLALPENAAYATADQVRTAFTESDACKTFTATVGKVGYYVTLARPDGELRYLWVDMDSPWRTVADLGLPTDNLRTKVSNLHVDTNVAGIDGVTDDGAEGLIQFYATDIGTAAADNAYPQTLGDCFDWNCAPNGEPSPDKTGYGAMQVFRVYPENAKKHGMPASTLFAYNRWGEASGAGDEIVLGDLATHQGYTSMTQPLSLTGVSTADHPTLNTQAYTVKRIEIFAKPMADIKPWAEWTDFSTSAPTRSSARYGIDGATFTFAPNGGTVKADGTLATGTGVAPSVHLSNTGIDFGYSGNKPATLLLTINTATPVNGKPFVYVATDTHGYGLAVNGPAAADGRQPLCTTWQNAVWNNNTVLELSAPTLPKTRFLALRLGVGPLEVAELVPGDTRIDWKSIEGMQAAHFSVKDLFLGNYRGEQADGMDMTVTRLALYAGVGRVPDSALLDLTDTYRTTLTQSGNEAWLFEDVPGKTDIYVDVTEPSSPASLVVNNSATDYILGGTYSIQGKTALVKQGLGTLTMAWKNNFSGGVVIEGGTLIESGLRAGNGSWLGTGVGAGGWASQVTLKNGIFDLNNSKNYTNTSDDEAHGGWLSVQTLILGGAPGTTEIRNGLFGIGTSTMLHYKAEGNPGTATISAALDMTGTSGNGAQRTLNIEDSLATEVEIDFTGGMHARGGKDGQGSTLIKDGAGTMRLACDYGFPGLHVKAGTLRIGKNNPFVSTFTTLTIDGTFDLCGHEVAVPTLLGAGKVTDSVGGGRLLAKNTTDFTGTIDPALLPKPLPYAITWLPVGDSITEGEVDMGHPERGTIDSRGGYRYQLWRELTLDGSSVRSVGFRTGHCGTVENGDWAYHAALYGGSIKVDSNGNHGRQAFNVESTLENAGYPDVITLLLGINDLSFVTPGKQDDTKIRMIFEDWTELVAKYADLRPDALVLPSTLLPTIPTNASAKAWGPFNALVRAAAVAKTAPFDRPNVVLADMAKLAFNDTFDATLFKRTDGLHPNEQGSIRIARAFAQVIRAELDKAARQPLGIVHVHNGQTDAVQVRLARPVTDVTAATLTLNGPETVTLQNGTVDTKDARVLSFSLNGTTLKTAAYTAALTLTAQGQTQTLAAPSTKIEILGSGAAANVKPAYLQGFTKLQTVQLSDNDSFANKGPAAEGNPAAPSRIARVGYYLELKRPGKPAQFVWVSMDAKAFGNDASKVGIPSAATGMHQAVVENLTVYANRGNFVKDETNGRGVIEFTPYTWNGKAQAGLPTEAWNNSFGWNDTLADAGTTYGCMQIARIDPTAPAQWSWQHPAAEMLFAYNKFNTDDPSDLGIGSFVVHRNNAGSAGTEVAFDWTHFSAQTGYVDYLPAAYDVKTLEIWVEPAADKPADEPEFILPGGGEGGTDVPVDITPDQKAVLSQALDAALKAAGLTAAEVKTVEIRLNGKSDATTAALAAEVLSVFTGLKATLTAAGPQTFALTADNGAYVMNLDYRFAVSDLAVTPADAGMQAVVTVSVTNGDGTPAGFAGTTRLDLLRSGTEIPLATVPVPADGAATMVLSAKIPAADAAVLLTVRARAASSTLLN